MQVNHFYTYLIQLIITIIIVNYLIWFKLKIPVLDKLRSQRPLLEKEYKEQQLQIKLKRKSRFEERMRNKQQQQTQQLEEKKRLW